MGIYRRGNNWYLDFYYNGKRYKESVGSTSKSVAKEKLIIRKREVIQGEYKPKIIQMPFDKFSEQYLEYSKGNKKPKSHLRDQTSMKHLLKCFENRMLSEINPFLVEKYKLTRKSEGAKEGTINRELACLRHLFTLAVKWGKALTNPVKGIKFFKEPKAKDRILSEEEEARLLDAVRSTTKSQHLEPIIITALNTGMRKGEILNLKKTNVDFNNAYILVEGTKNGEFRKIPMNKKLTQTLRDVIGKSKSEFVFSENGKPYGDVKTGWWTVLKKAGIENFRFHDLRHTFGSRLGMAGVDLGTIQELMGHKDIKMTKRYSHPTPEHKKKAVEILDGTTPIFTPAVQKEERQKVVNIGNY